MNILTLLGRMVLVYIVAWPGLAGVYCFIAVL